MYGVEDDRGDEGFCHSGAAAHKWPNGHLSGERGQPLRFSARGAARNSFKGTAFQQETLFLG